MSNVTLTSGSQPRYMSFGAGVLSTTTAIASNGIYKESPYSTFQAIITGTGAVTATVDLQGSNEPATFAGTKANWVSLGTPLSLSGTTTDTKGLVSTSTWRYVRANVSAISGTGATVEVLMGV